MKRFLLIRGAELLALLVLAAIPLVITNPFALGLLTLLAIYGILLIGLDVTVGYLGQVNLSQAAFLGIGAYTAGLLVTNGGYSILFGLACAFLLCLVLGALLALPALRLEGPQFALATLSFGALAVTVLLEWEELTLGAQGFSVTRPPLFGHALDATWFYWLCVGLLALVWMGMRNLLSSQWGRAFEALRDSPIATDAMGVGTYRHKVIAFAFGSALGGLAGGLYAFNFQYLDPHSFTYELMVILLLGVVLGGRKSLWGAVVGAAFIVLLPNLLSNPVMFRFFSIAGLLIALIGVVQGLMSKSGDKSAAFKFQTLAPVVAMAMLVIGSFTVSNTEDWRKAIFALMLFSVVVGLPEGLMGFAGKLLTKLFRVPAAPLPPASDLDEVVPMQPADGSTLLELKQLKRHFGGVKAVDGVNMVVKAGTVHGLIGPNGSGKSTAVNVISGLYTPTSGELLLDGKALPYGSLYQVAGAGVSRTFQNLQLFGELTALDNVMVALRDTYKMPWPLVLLGLARGEEKKAQADALALLQLVGLEAQALSRAKDLTYGAQRFLEIARALARKPRLLILDEPAAGLAHPDAHNLVEIIRRINGRGIAIVLIEHHMDVVTALCNTVTVLDGGQVIAEGPSEEVKRNPKVVEAYLGAAA
ncbi:MAG TPA: branched-chain amino acid ABC transporter ATP-binding protein/permease [Rhodocyclaceae bacterium]|nr:branched-chain amino acid ABC transporter ATP-binding protein/permease [Rhodocyclaceae bacterium]